jgi:hypothetical protein
MSRPDSLRVKGLKRHVDTGKTLQNGRGYKELVHYLEHGDEFGDAMTIARLMKAFNRSRPTITKWIVQYCEERNVPYPDDLQALLIK